MSRIVNELDSIHFSIKKATKLVKELGRQVRFQALTFILILLAYCQLLSHLCSSFVLFKIATDRCVMAMLFLIVMGVVAIVIVKVRHSCTCQ